MSLRSRIVVATATIAVAVGGATPALASSSSKKWTKSQCKAYVKKYAKSKGKAMTNANKTLKTHGCTEKVK